MTSAQFIVRGNEWPSDLNCQDPLVNLGRRRPCTWVFCVRFFDVVVQISFPILLVDDFEGIFTLFAALGTDVVQRPVGEAHSTSTAVVDISLVKVHLSSQLNAAREADAVRPAGAKATADLAALRLGTAFAVLVTVTIQNHDARVVLKRRPPDLVAAGIVVQSIIRRTSIRLCH